MTPKLVVELASVDAEGARSAHAINPDLVPRAFSIAGHDIDYGQFPLSPIVAVQIARLIRKPILGRGRKYFLTQRTA